MEFSPISKPPRGFTPCLIRRDLEMPLKYGVRERRSEFVISSFTGYHFLGREENWIEWAEIPAEDNPGWIHANIFLPEERVPVLVILPQPKQLTLVKVSAGIHFGLYDRLNEPTWRIYIRETNNRIIEDPGPYLSKQWVAIGKKGVSSWMELPKLNEKLRTDDR